MGKDWQGCGKHKVYRFDCIDCWCPCLLVPSHNEVKVKMIPHKELTPGYYYVQTQCAPGYCLVSVVFDHDRQRLVVFQFDETGHTELEDWGNVFMCKVHDPQFVQYLSGKS